MSANSQTRGLEYLFEISQILWETLLHSQKVHVWEMDEGCVKDPNFQGGLRNDDTCLKQLHSLQCFRTREWNKSLHEML